MNKLLLLPVILGLSLATQAQNKPNKYQFEQQKAKMWSAVDVNNDNKITRQEALSKASELFDNQDLDKDGVLTRDEVQNRTILKSQKNFNKEAK